MSDGQTARETRDGTIVWQPECHCFGCGQGGLGLQTWGGGPVEDLKKRGWERIARRWHCADCVKDRRP